MVGGGFIQPGDSKLLASTLADLAQGFLGTGINLISWAFLGCSKPWLPHEDGGGQPGAQYLLAAGSVGQKGATVLCQE